MEKAARRAGRPITETPKAGVGGKGRVITINVSLEMREALEAEAERTGRPMSQIAERWMEDARRGRAQYDQLLGGDIAIASAVENLVRIARTVKAVVTDERFTSEALLVAWRTALPRLTPAAPITPETIKIALQADEVWEACDAVREAITAAGPSDPVYQRANETLYGQGLVGTTPLFERLAIALTRSDDNLPSAYVVAALAELRAAGPTARAEIDQALPLATKFVTDSREMMKAKATALGIGLRVGLEASSPRAVGN